MQRHTARSLSILYLKASSFSFRDWLLKCSTHNSRAVNAEAQCERSTCTRCEASVTILLTWKLNHILLIAETREKNTHHMSTRGLRKHKHSGNQIKLTASHRNLITVARQGARFWQNCANKQRGVRLPMPFAVYAVNCVYHIVGKSYCETRFLFVFGASTPLNYTR